MAHPSSFFAPSEGALEFGAKYAESLKRWGELFAAASAVVETNVDLGHMSAAASKEFEEWLKGTANSPFNWFSPDAMQRFAAAMGGAGGTAKP